VKLLPQPETDFDYLKKDEAGRFLTWTRDHAADTFRQKILAVEVGTTCELTAPMKA
jgi:hypothetical protein